MQSRGCTVEEPNLSGKLGFPLRPSPVQGELEGGLEAACHLAVDAGPQLPGIECACQQHAPLAPNDLVPNAHCILQSTLLAGKGPGLQH